MAGMRPLRRRVIEDMTVRNLSPASERSYVHAVAWFGRFFGRSPDKRNLEDVRAFQVHLVAGGISEPALNQTVCAHRFETGSRSSRQTCQSGSRMGGSQGGCPWCWGPMKSCVSLESGAQPKGACRADYGLCGRTARVGSSEPQGRQLSGARSSASDKWRNMAVNPATGSRAFWMRWHPLAGDEWYRGFALSHWQHKRDNIGTGSRHFSCQQPCSPRHCVVGRAGNTRQRRKCRCIRPLCSPPSLTQSENRGKDNALIMRGIILDIEHSTSSPEGFPAIFPELQMVLYSSFNHTWESPRYRICIPTTHFVTPQINEVICWTIARVRSGHTVWIPANSTAPPCSIVPITAPRCS